MLGRTFPSRKHRPESTTRTKTIRPNTHAAIPHALVVLQRADDPRRQNVTQVRARVMRAICLRTTYPHTKRTTRTITGVLQYLARRHHAEPRMLLVTLRRVQQPNVAQKLVTRTHDLTRWLEQRDRIVVRVPKATTSVHRHLLILVDEHPSVRKNLDHRCRNNPTSSRNLERRSTSSPVRRWRAGTTGKSGKTNGCEQDLATHEASR